MTTTKLSAPSNVMSEATMDRLIWAAWRAFWVGLGASAVIVAQSLLAPAAPPSAAEIAPPAVQHHDASIDAPRVSAAKVRTRTAS
jgi:hypothetical protein